MLQRAYSDRRAKPGSGVGCHRYVADGQFLAGSDGQIAPSSPPLPQDVLSSKVVEFTTAAMTTLLSQQ